MHPPIDRNKLQSALELSGPPLDNVALRAFVQYAYINHLSWRNAWKQAKTLRDQRRSGSLFTIEEVSNKLGLTETAMQELMQIVSKNPIKPANLYGMYYYSRKKYDILLRRLHHPQLWRWISRNKKLTTLRTEFARKKMTAAKNRKNSAPLRR